MFEFNFQKGNLNRLEGRIIAFIISICILLISINNLYFQRNYSSYTNIYKMNYISSQTLRKPINFPTIQLNNLYKNALKKSLLTQYIYLKTVEGVVNSQIISLQNFSNTSKLNNINEEVSKKENAATISEYSNTQIIGEIKEQKSEISEEEIERIRTFSKQKIDALKENLQNEIEESITICNKQTDLKVLSDLDVMMNKECIYDLTKQDKLYIAKLVYGEAKSESFEGQVAVAAVVLNRYAAENSGFTNDTIYDVITQRNQFVSIDSITDMQLENYPSCMDAVEVACRGYDPTREVFEDGAKFFYSTNGISENEAAKREGVEKYVIGGHTFHNEFA